VVVAELKNLRINKIIAMDSAKVKVNPREQFNEVQITAHNTYQVGPEDEGGFFAEWLSLTTEFGSLLSDDIKFKNIDEMKRIQLDLMRFYPIAKLARQTYAQLTTELLAEDINNQIEKDPNGFYTLFSGKKLVKFNAGSCVVQDERKVILTGKVMVVESGAASKQILNTLRAEKALLAVEGDELAPTLTMDIYSARVEGSGDLRFRHIIRGLIIPQRITDITNTFATEGGLNVKKLASQPLTLQKGPSTRLTGLQDRLRRKIQKTMAQIEAEMHSRLVFGVGCLSMILIGIGLGIIKKGGHLLTAFGASCVPAAVLIVCIMCGKNIAENLGSQSISGIGLMWMGLAFLSLLAAIIYYRLLKH